MSPFRCPGSTEDQRSREEWERGQGTRGEGKEATQKSRGILEPFGASVFHQLEMFVRFALDFSPSPWSDKGCCAGDPDCLGKAGAGVSLSQDRWVEVKTLIAAFWGGSDSLSYLPSQQRKISLLLHSSLAGTSLKKKAERRETARFSERFGDPS